METEEPAVTPVVARNIGALVERSLRRERSRRRRERLADHVTAFTGSIASVAVHAVLFGIWVLLNVGLLPHHFDRSLVILATLASVEGIFLTTFVLISQNRMQVSADQRRARPPGQRPG